MRKPLSPPPIDLLISKLLEADNAGARRFVEISTAGIGPAPNNSYRHWDILRHLSPPEGLSHEEWWLGIKMARRHLMRDLPFVATNGASFTYAMFDRMMWLLREIDKEGTGAIRGGDLVTNPSTRDTYIIKSLVEEAITSSQLEGASTTRQVAKEMIKSGREPRTHSERMIHNNYLAMMFIRDLKHESLTPGIVFELHRMLTRGTLKESDAAGRFRREDERIEVVDEAGQILHTPPPAAALESRLNAMCAFANESSRDQFMHPVVRSIVLHFWLAYDHPFIDGNGRTARALFYWSMAHSDYWLCEFLSISRILKKGPSKYARSFLFTESDDNDVTYFIMSQLSVISRAIKDLHVYLASKVEELNETKRFIQESNTLRSLLNHRQIGLINHALKNPLHGYTIESHKRSHGISYHTARTDLLTLARHGLLDQDKFGGTLHFKAPLDLRERLERVRHPS